MSLEGVAAVQQRIAAIQALDRPSVDSGSAAGIQAIGSSQFASVLQSASQSGPIVAVDGENGRLDETQLKSIGIDGHRLQPRAADAFVRMRAAAQLAGVEIGVTDSYRSYDQQVDLVRRKGLYSQGGLGATPGTSQHGWGLALDLDLDESALAWMRANAAQFGFYEDVPREPWHWEFEHGR